MKAETKTSTKNRKDIDFMQYSLWGAVSVLLIILLIILGASNLKGSKERLIKSMGQDLETAIAGEYKDYEFSYKSFGYRYLKDNEKIGVNEVFKSLADNHLYEIADTVYETELKFKGNTVSISLSAKYKDLNMHEELGIKDYLELGENEYWDKVIEHVTSEFKYKHTGKVPLEQILEVNQAQCYSLSELGYLLGKERGSSVRMGVNQNHAWNVILIDGYERMVDLTYGMEQIN